MKKRAGEWKEVGVEEEIRIIIKERWHDLGSDEKEGKMLRKKWGQQSKK